jgi:cytoskeletal protein RodZ
MEQLREIGAYLRQIRQDQSISLEEVAKKTFIPLRLLKALEEGQLDRLPEPVFVQGFIRRYAEVLNLDGLALAKTFPMNPPPKKPEPEIAEAPSPPPPPSPAPSPSSSFSLKPYLPYLLTGVVALVALVSLLVPKPQTANSPAQEESSPTAEPETPPTSAESSPPVPSPVASPSPSPSPVASPSPSPSPTSPVQVTVTLQGSSWLRVSADGKTEFEGILNEGAKQTWTAKENLTVRAGDAGAVLTSLNGQEPKALGNRGEVKETTFTP